MFKRKTTVLGMAVLALTIVSSSGLRAGAGGATGALEPQLIDDAALKAATTTDGGADVLPTTRTIPHWWGSSVDPHDGRTYGYNMAGANPYTCTGAACSVTIEVDITPIVVHVAGRTYDGNNVLAATLASPQFALNDYGSTPAATSGVPNMTRGAGGLLSQDDSGNGLQLQDATMRRSSSKLRRSRLRRIRRRSYSRSAIAPTRHAN